jgi:predicted porin
MKKSLLALAVLGAYAGVASAQSSVTIFGVVDLSVNQIKNGDLRTTSMQSNQLNSNRLGFRGYEDLGGGLGAGFWLEGGMNNANGTGGTAGAFDFRRRSTVSLISQTAGEVRLGRDYVPTFSNLGAFDVFGANGIGNNTNIISAIASPANTAGGAGTGVRANNSVAYHLPGNLGGFYGTAMYALGQGNDNNKYWGVRAGFATGPFDVALAFGNTDTVTPNDFEVWNVGASWNLGFMRLYGLYHEGKLGGLKEKVFEISAGIPLGQGEFRIAYTQADDSGSQGPINIGGSDANLLGIQYIYNLSKRTAIYGGYATLDNDPGSSRSILNGTIGSNAATQAQVGNTGATLTQLSGQKSSGFNVGVRHSF